MFTLHEPLYAVVYVVCFSLVSLIEATCYYPDKSVVPVAARYVPCNATVADGVYSACCSEGDGCTTAGYCLGNAGFAYRGGCTDVNWASESCCPSCRSDAIHSFSNLYPCPVSNGSFATTWCCGAVEGSAEAAAGCCDTTQFNVNADGFGNLFGVAQAYTAPTAASSSPATSTSGTTKSSSEPASASKSANPSTASSTKPASSSNPSAAIGAGVGVPLGILLLSGLAFLLHRERKQRLHAQKVANDISAVMKEREAKGMYQGYELSNHAGRQELGLHGSYGGRFEELDARSANVYEADGYP